MASNAERRRRFFKSFEAESLRSRSVLTQLADTLTEICGSTTFLFLHILIFSAWIGINSGLVPEITPFDPFPFGLLTMVVSLEAIFLSIFVLVSQNRSAYINTIREETHLSVNLIAEEEITKALQILAEIRQEVGIKKPDPELDKMLHRIDTSYLEQAIVSQLQNARDKSVIERLTKQFPEVLMYPVKKPIELVQNIADGDKKADTPKQPTT